MSRNRNWETEYENFKIKLEELKGEFDNKTITKEEYRQMVIGERNLPKLENLLDLKKRLERTKSQIIEELYNRDNLVEVDESQKLEEELNKIIEDKERIKKELKNDKLTDEEKEKLEKEFSELEDKFQGNNSKYIEMKNKEKDTPKKENFLKNMTKEDLKKSAVQINVKLSICNLYGTRLIKGRSVENIKETEEQIDWNNRNADYEKQIEEDVKKFKISKEEKDKLKNLKDISKEKDLEKDLKKDVDKDNKSDEKDKSLIELSEFEQKHPKLAKIKNWFSKIFDKKESKKEGKTESENNTEKSESSKHNDFVKNLKEIENLDVSKVAESGLDNLNKENAMKKLLENKQKAAGKVDEKSVKNLETKLKEKDNEER